MLSQSDNTSATAPTDTPPIVTPDEDGFYTCDLCCMKIRVGCGGSKNFLQHRSSPACLRVAKKREKPKTSQTNTIQSYFTKATYSGTSNQNNSQTKAQTKNAQGQAQGARQGIVPKATPPHLPTPGPLCQASLSVSAHPGPGPDAHALALLANITHAAQELPSLVPEADEDDDIAHVILAEGPEDPSEAWEHLDRGLNRFLGYGVDVEDIMLQKGMCTIALVSPNSSPFLAPELLPPEDDLLPREHADTSPSLPPSSPRLSQSVNTSDGDDDIEYIGTLPLPVAIKDAIAPVHRPPMPKSVNNAIDRPAIPKKVQCKQHVVSTPPGQTGIGAYPFLLHTEEHMPWEFSSHCGSLLLHARKCENRNLDKDGLCEPCRALLSNTKFRNVLSRIEDGVNENAPYKFHRLSSLTEIARKKDCTIDLFCLRRTNDGKKLVGREGTITMHHQVLLAMSSGKIPRLDRILCVASDHHMSVAAILDLIRKVGCGIYHPKGFDEDEDLQTLLFLRLGGQRVAVIAHHMFGIPAPSTVRRRTMIPPLICSPSYPLVRDLEANLVAAFDSLSPNLAARGRLHAVLMLDEIAQETRPRWCDRTNQILGWCQEHTKGKCMDFNSIADVELLFGEMTALNAIKGVDALQNTRVVSIASDGEAKWGKALVLLTFKQMLSPSSPIYPWLSACTLLDLHVSDDDITCDKDWKHTGAKRPRNALLREKGLLMHGIWITPAVLRSHLLEAGYKPQHIRAMLNPNDKQDVLLAYTLLRDIWSLPLLTSGALGRINARESLCLFGSMCHHFLMPYICVDLSIEDQLEYLSYVAHLALVLYAHDKACNDFIPTALYVNLILMVKNVFFCVAKAKIDTPNDDFNIILLGTDCLENLFGCLHTIIGNDANIDNYQLGSRLTGTMESANILAMHPEWDKAPRRLHLPCVSRDSSEIPASADHISPCSWRASQALSSLTPPTLWIRGRHRLENDHPFSRDILHAVEAIPGATVLAPFGTLLVHASLPVDDIEDSSHDDILHGLVQDAVSSDPLNAPITGNGMCDFEDTATSLDWAPQQHTFSNVVAVDDNTATLNKSQALSLLFKYSKSTSSADQLRRVQQQAHFVQSDPETLLDDSSDETGALLMVNNPIASLISCEENIFLCVGEIIGIHLGSKAVDYLHLDVLLEDTVHITYQVYSLVCTYPDDDNLDSDTNLPKNDWKTSSLLLLKLKVPGNLIQPINPSLAMPSSHAPYYLFDTPTLIALTFSLRDRLINPQLKFVPCAAQTDHFPYRERSGQACFVAEDLYDYISDGGVSCGVASSLVNVKCSSAAGQGGTEGSVGPKRYTSMHECPACMPPVQLDTSNGQRVLAHIASHILHDLTIDKSQEPCGLCLQPAALCTIYLTRCSGRNYQWALKYGGIAPCPNATNFSYMAAMVSSDSSPCSNVPLQCPYCSDGSPAVWRYNMRLHFQHQHPGVDTAKHQDLWKITPEEATAMKQIWDDRHRQCRPCGKGKSKVPLKVSDAHSSWRLSSYIACSDRITHDDVQDSDINEERVGEQEGGSSEDNNVPNAVVEVQRQELSSKVCDDGQSWTHGAEGSSEGTSAAMITSVDGNDAARSDCIDSGEGGLEALVGSIDPGIGAISVDLAVETNKDAPERTANISVPTSPRTDNVTVLTTEHPTETEDDSSFLRGAQVSSFGRKRKLNKLNMPGKVSSFLRDSIRKAIDTRQGPNADRMSCSPTGPTFGDPATVALPFNPVLAKVSVRPPPPLPPLPLPPPKKGGALLTGRGGPKPIPGDDELSVFDILNTFRHRWFLSLEHLVKHIISAQKAEDGTFSWVEFSPPFHSHLVKYAVALVPHPVRTVKRVMFVFLLELLNREGHLAFFELQKGGRKANNAQKEKRHLAWKRSRAAKCERDREAAKVASLPAHEWICVKCGCKFTSRKTAKKHKCSDSKVVCVKEAEGARVELRPVPIAKPSKPASSITPHAPTVKPSAMRARANPYREMPCSVWLASHNTSVPPVTGDSGEPFNQPPALEENVPHREDFATVGAYSRAILAHLDGLDNGVGRKWRWI
ncbi:hypothetical protein EI94DRAFT_1703360 [Lactarius quietus]|nr:hypothetical protein EI94DRAFT_1703360 [Lactarius quietus]